MNKDDPAVSIGIFSKGDQRAELHVTHGDRLRLTHTCDLASAKIDLGEATAGRIDFLISCLQQLRAHAKDA